MESKDILLHAQESAAKALGGGSRGMFLLFLFYLYFFWFGCLGWLC